MTQEEKRIKLAEAAGWRIEKANFHTMHVWEPGAKLPARLGLNMGSKLPDYFRNLNAVHELEKVLTEEQRRSYCDFTYDIACRIQKETGKWNWISLPAAQRAEALGLTLNLWK